jgi:cobalt/nickel transport system permease protein
MHIPDGYLSPVVSLGMGGATVPTWAVATRKVRDVLDNRTVPLLAIFSAMSFTIMMFNVPVPGGTTAHGVGGTLIAIVLGPWAAVIAVSTALIIQAVFFGDGGILAIFANCLNMGIILPVVGYLTYRLIAGRAPLLSSRRVWAAGIGAYVGITVAALAVGIELGIQPLLFSEHGHAIYSPYGLREAIPAMVAAHALGASIVEAVITAFGVTFFQQRHPEYLTSMRRAVLGEEVPVGRHARLGRFVYIGMAILLVDLLLVGGLISGHGDPTRLFGANWSQVSWPDVAIMLVIVAVMLAIIVPAAWLILPKRLRRAGTVFAAVAVTSPLGLIAPGFAYGESGGADLKQAFGYIPSGFRRLNGFFSAPLDGYNVKMPFFSGDTAPLWHQAIGYEISGAVGILLLGVIVYGGARLLGRGNRHGEMEPSVASRPMEAS